MSDASDEHDIRETVRQRYAAAATLASAGEHGHARTLEASSCCGVTVPGTTDEDGCSVFGADLYSEAAADGASEAAVAASLGCGVPTAVADLHPGETVLDLGSGAGVDVLISARRVGPAGKAIGLDMTAEMLDLARRNAADAGVDNVEFVQGYLEDIPLPDASVDVVLSNCVINLAADKHLVLRDATRADMAAWTGCIAGALTAEQYQAALLAAGLINVKITETHRVHSHAASALIHARKPGDTAG